MRRAIILLFTVALASFTSQAAAEQGTWQPRLTLHAGGFNAITYISASNVVAGGPDGIVLSQDGGRSWSWVSDSSVLDIDVAGDGQHAWAVGGQGEILATADGGRTWSPQSSGTSLDLFDVAAIDAHTALAVGASSPWPVDYTLLRTDDAGQTWHKDGLPPDYVPGRLTVLRNNKRVWLTAAYCHASTFNGPCEGLSGPVLLRSDDRGESWEKVDAGHYLSSVSFVNERVGWAEENRGESGPLLNTTLLERTEDGGASWVTVRDSSDTGWRPEGFVALNDRTVILAEYAAEDGAWRLIETKDAGKTWQQLEGPGKDSIGPFSFLDESHGVRSGTKGSLKWTDDGKTWHVASTPPFVGRHAGVFDFVDSNNGWLGASQLLRTRDSGLTWEAISDLEPTQIDFVSVSEGWAVAPSCDIPPCDYDVLHTVDGGSTWQRQTTVGNREPEGLQFVDSLNGWLFRGTGQPALRTRDGGKTWQEWQPPGDRLALVNADLAWSAGPQGDVYLSHDGGESWTRTAGAIPDPDPQSCGPDLLAAVDAQHAWVITTKCRDRPVPTIYRTVDGGNTWQALPGGGGVGAFATLSFFSPTEGIALRAICPETDVYGPCDEVVMRTNDGGLSWSYQDAAPFQGFNFEAFRFLSSNSGFGLWTSGGGILPIRTQTLYAYNAPPSDASARIVVPGTGEGHSDDTQTVALVTLAAFGALIGLGGFALRRCRRDG